VIQTLLSEAPPEKIRGGYRAFSQGAQQAATGAQFSFAGCRVQAPFGVLISAGILTHMTANITAFYRLGMGLFPVAPTTPAVYRDQSTVRPGTSIGLSTTLFGAGAAAVAPGGITSGIVRPPTTMVIQPIMCLVPKGFDFLIVDETVNVALIITLFGVEFQTAEAMKWFRDRLA